MDMNQLLHAHQIAVIGKARTTASAPRAAYRDTIVLLAATLFPLLAVVSISLRPGNFATGSLIPETISFETAAASMLKVLTVHYLLKKTLPVEGLQPGDFLLNAGTLNQHLRLHSQHHPRG